MDDHSTLAHLGERLDKAVERMGDRVVLVGRHCSAGQCRGTALS